LARELFPNLKALAAIDMTTTVFDPCPDDVSAVERLRIKPFVRR
jgi:hypothetical protein